MKYLAQLPNKQYYRPIESPNEGKYNWEDKSTTALRITSPVPDPWSRKQWVIMPALMKGKADKSAPYRLILRLFLSADEATSATIVRKEINAIFAWSDYQPHQFYAFPLRDREWIFYSFYTQEEV